jgi:hypothetical protein
MVVYWRKTVSTYYNIRSISKALSLSIVLDSDHRSESD